MQTQIRDSFSYLFGISLVLVTFLVSSTVPFVFQYVTTYAAPTAVYALWISASGHVAPLNLGHTYWPATLETEREFPVPAILLSTFMSVTGLPREVAMFVPITGAGAIVYLALSRLVIANGRRKGSNIAHILLFSAFSYAYICYNLGGYGIAALYMGRGTFGVLLLAYFVLAYLSYLHPRAGRSSSSSWIPIMAILTFAVGLTYYISILAIALATIFTAPIARLLLFRRKAKLAGFQRPILSITFAALALSVYGPLRQTFYALSGSVSLLSFAHNIWSLFITTLKLNAGSAAYLLNVGAVDLDPFTHVTSVWMANPIKLLSAIVIIYAIIAYRPKDQEPPSPIWSFAMIAFFVSIAESAYLFTAVVIPIRFFSLFGGIVLFFLLEKAVEGAQASGIRGKNTARRKRLLLGSCLLVMLLATVGSVNFQWSYGVATPGSYNQMIPLSNFLAIRSSAQQPVVLVGDAGYTADLFFMSYNQNRTSDVIPRPLEAGGLSIWRTMVGRNANPIIKYMMNQDERYLLIVQNGRPIWSDEWGPAFTVPAGGLRSLDGALPVVYSDGTAVLYSLY
jgi:hypothetical protein